MSQISEAARVGYTHLFFVVETLGLLCNTTMNIKEAVSWSAQSGNNLERTRRETATNTSATQGSDSKDIEIWRKDVIR